MPKKKKEQTEDAVKHEILVGYVTDFTFQDKVAEAEFSGHPQQGRIYQIIRDEIFGYRLHIGSKFTKQGLLEGILLGTSLVGDIEGKWTFNIDIINSDNFLSFDLIEEDAAKLAYWFDTNNADLQETLEKPVAKVATDENGVLVELNDAGEILGDFIEFTPHEDGILLAEDIRMNEFSHNLNLIYKKDSGLMEVLTDLTAYLATTFGDKYEATKRPNFSKAFLHNSNSPDVAIFNTMKYLQRYTTVGFDKSANIKDVYKAIHYLLFELERAKNNA